MADLTAKKYSRLQQGETLTWQRLLVNLGLRETSVPLTVTFTDLPLGRQVYLIDEAQPFYAWIGEVPLAVANLHQSLADTIITAPWYIERLSPTTAGVVISSAPPVEHWASDTLAAALTALRNLHLSHQRPTPQPGLPLLLDAPFAGLAPAVERFLGLAGWPGVLLEEQVQRIHAAIQQPAALLAPLQALPTTLLHGDPALHAFRRRADGSFLLQPWSSAAHGPAVYDLAGFLCRLPLIEDASNIWRDFTSPTPRITLIDQYLGPTAAPGVRAAFQSALPAAEVVFTLRHWLPRLNDYFSILKPSRAIWRTFAKFPPAQLARLGLTPLFEHKPYFTDLFAQIDATLHDLGY